MEKLFKSINDLLQAIDDNRENWEVPKDNNYSDKVMTVIPYQYIGEELENCERILKEEIYNYCVKLYEDDGYLAVIRFCDENKIGEPKYCYACEDTMPSLDGHCLCCGERNKTSEEIYGTF